MTETASVPHTENPVVLRIAPWTIYVRTIICVPFFAYVVHGILGTAAAVIVAILFIFDAITCLLYRLELTDETLTSKGIFVTRSIRRDQIAYISQRNSWTNNMHKNIKLHGIPPARTLSVDGFMFDQKPFTDWIAGIPDSPRETARETHIAEQQADAEALGKMAEETPVFGARKDQRKQNFLTVNLMLLFWVTLGVPVDLLLCVSTENPAVLFWVPMAFTGGALLYILLQPQKILFFRPVAPSFSASVWFRTGAILGVHSLLISMAALIAVPGEGTAKFLYWGIAVAAVFFFALRHAVPDLKSAGKRIKVAAFCALILFSYSGLRMANVLFDGQSIRHVTMALKSVDPHTGHVKIGTHLKNLMPANQIAQIIDLAFPNPEPGQSVCVRFGPGALGTLWLLPDKGCDKIR